MLAPLQSMAERAKTDKAAAENMFRPVDSVIMCSDLEPGQPESEQALNRSDRRCAAAAATASGRGRRHLTEGSGIEAKRGQVSSVQPDSVVLFRGGPLPPHKCKPTLPAEPPPLDLPRSRRRLQRRAPGSAGRSKTARTPPLRSATIQLLTPTADDSRFQGDCTPRVRTAWCKDSNTQSGPSASTPEKTVCPQTRSEQCESPQGTLLAHLMSKCIDCGTSFENFPSAKYCLKCGEPRMENCLFEEIFEMVAGPRVTMRKMDLPKFIWALQQFLQKLTHGKRTSSRQLILDTECAYQESIRNQKDSGCAYTHGITREFMYDFLQRIADNSDLTCRSLVYGLLGQDGGSVNGSDDSQSLFGPYTSQHSQHAAAACPSCGCEFVSAAKFCCHCGLKQRDKKSRHLDAFHIFDGTRNLSMGCPDEGTLDEKDFAELVRISRVHRIPMYVVRTLWQEFKSFNVNNDDVLDSCELAEVIRKHCQIPQDAEIPTHLLHTGSCQESGERQHMNFEDFVLWLR